MPTATEFRDQARAAPPVASWAAGERIDAALFQDAAGRFRGSVLREILLAAAGCKVSRLGLDDSGRVELQRLAGRHRFFVVEGRLGYAASIDAGKGQFSNMARLTDSGEGRRTYTYVARSVEHAQSAREMEERHDSSGFGELLGIPACCRDAYRRFEPIARRVQGDLVPQVWSNTPAGQPFDPWINVVVRYFGTNLISFFPCSFRCVAASSVAKHTYRLLAEVSPEWADSFIVRQHANVLYTEHQGVHSIDCPVERNTIFYSADRLRSTQNTPASRLLRRGNRMEIVHGQCVVIHRDDSRIGTIAGPNVFACLFRHGSTDPVVA